MKLILYMLILSLIGQPALSQINDTLPVHNDSNNIRTDNLPVLTDSSGYQDTIISKTAGSTDTVVQKRVHSPRRATIYSTVLPGLGQVYNKKYWKVPIVYTAIGVPTALFFYNKKWYNKCRFALSLVANDRFTADSLSRVDPELRPLVDSKAANSLISYRNDFRRNMDYSALFVLLMWGLNIVDATVDAHLKGFDVNDDLSLHLKPGLVPGTRTPGLSLVVNFK